MIPKQNTRGQAYTIEAFITAIFIVTVVIFIAPSFATPVSNADLDDAVRENQHTEHLNSITNYYQSQGTLKSAVLNYNTNKDQWQYDTNISYSDPQPSDRREYTDISAWEIAVSSPQNHESLNDLVEDLEDYQRQYSVAIEVYLESTNSSGSTKIIPVVSNPRNDTGFTKTTAVVTETVTLYGTDTPRTQADAHARTSSVLPTAYQVESQKDTLYDIEENIGSKEFVVGPHDQLNDPHEVYNTVTLIFVVKE